MDTQRRWINLQNQFEEACLDFIQLQGLDFEGWFSCPHGASSLTADGITLGLPLQRAGFARPWKAAEGEAPVAGSLFKDRAMVPQPQLRKQLLLFCSKAGVAAAEHQQLIATVSSVPAAPAEGHTARVLLPFVATYSGAGASGEQRRPLPADLPLLRAMASGSPASQVLPAADQLELAHTAPHAARAIPEPRQPAGERALGARNAAAGELGQP